MDFTIKSDDYVSLNQLSSLPVGTEMTVYIKGKQWLRIQLSETKPPVDSTDGYLLTHTYPNTPFMTISPDSLEVWVKAAHAEVPIFVDSQRSGTINHYGSAIDPRVYEGMATFNVQSYDESNKKLGLQWEASRMVTGSLNQRFTSIIKTGEFPVDLKKREFAYRGTGLVAQMFKDPVYSGGTNDPIYNMRPSQGLPQTELLTGFTLTSDGIECAAPIYAIGPDTNQTSGAATASYASNRILEPNTTYLLTFYSLDTANQQIAARIEFYEGRLDLNP